MKLAVIFFVVSFPKKAPNPGVCATCAAKYGLSPNPPMQKFPWERFLSNHDPP